jgi:predicted neuraminidase
VLYQVPGGDLLLFYKIGPSPAAWKGWLIRSKDGGVSWSKPWALPKGFIGPIKDKPVRLANGTLLCPSSTEGNGWKVHFELTDDKATNWRMAGPVAAPGSQVDANSEDKEPAAFQAIQPTIVLHADGRIEALCRSKNRAILTTSSTDNGKTWSPLAATSLPNNNSGIDAVTLADGRELLVYNHVLPPPGESRGARSPLNVAVSKDGKLWYGAVVLENDMLGEYSYPAVIQSADGMVHIVYTWRRKKIRYVEIDLTKLEGKEMGDGIARTNKNK